MLIPTLLSAAVATLEPNVQVVEADDVRIETLLESQRFVWTITNVDTAAIDDVRIPFAISYNFAAPNGWQWDTNDGIFHAWAINPSAMLRRGDSASFEMRAGSGGPALGLATMELGQLGTDDTLSFEVWAPATRPLGQSWATLVTMLALGGCSALFARRGQRRSASSGR